MNPDYGQLEQERVQEYMKSGGWIMEHRVTRELEDRIRDYTGARYAHMVTSATAGLLIAAIAAGIKPGKAFAACGYTQAATVNGALALGGDMHLVDAEKEAFSIDLDQIPSDCSVVFVTSINGRLPDHAVTKIEALRNNGVFVIEDSAQSLGSFVQEKHLGTIGDIGVFSFGAPKIITTGQGGCLITNDEAISNEIHAIKNFGRTVSHGEIYNTFGLNFKFTDVQAAIGLAQFERLPEIIEHKKSIYSWYRNNLNDVVDFVYTDLTNVTPIYPEILSEKREHIMKALTDANIGYRAAYNSLARQPYHSGISLASLPNAEYIADRGLHLPSQHCLTRNDVDYISETIRKAIYA